MKYSNSRWSTRITAAHVCTGPIPTAFSTSCVQTMWPEIKPVTVTKGNVLKTDTGQVEPFIRVI